MATTSEARYAGCMDLALEWRQEDKIVKVRLHGLQLTWERGPAFGGHWGHDSCGISETIDEVKAHGPPPQARISMAHRAALERSIRETLAGERHEKSEQSTE